MCGAYAIQTQHTVHWRTYSHSLWAVSVLASVADVATSTLLFRLDALLPPLQDLFLDTKPGDNATPSQHAHVRYSALTAVPQIAINLPLRTGFLLDGMRDT